MDKWTTHFRGPLDAALVRCLAILLVTNSHLDALYPIRQLATGGALGNAIFFAASGYGLALSIRHAPITFAGWYWQRLIRLYPSVFIVVAIFELGIRGGWSHWGVVDLIAAFLWPTPAWFISAILLFYVLIYPFLRLNKSGAYLSGLAALGGVYAYSYFTQVDLTSYSIEGPTRFKWIFYFALMLIGGFLTTWDNPASSPRVRDGWFVVCLLFFYFGFAFFLSKGYLTGYQFLIHAITVPLIVYFFKLAKSNWLQGLIGRFPLAINAVFLLSGVTLEIYLLQYYVYSSPLVTTLPFPANTLSFWVAVVALAWLTAAGAAWVRGFLPRRVRPIAGKLNDVK